MTDVLLKPALSSALRRPRVGFLGVGWIGRHRMAAMLDGGRIEAAAIADPNPDMAREALGLAPDAAACADLDDLLAQGLDGLVIATPSALHAEQTQRALNAGVAVFCQKPLGRNEAEAQTAIAAAKRADRLLAVDLSYRHTAAVQALKAQISTGRLGRIHAADLTFHNAYGPDKPWFYDAALSGGGCLMDLGVHLVDLCLWLLDEEVASVEAHLLREGRPLEGRREAEDYAVATLVLKSGVVVRLACSWRLPAGQDAVIEAAFYGDRGGVAMRIDVTYLADTVILLRYFEAQGEVRRAVSVIKKRAGQHETTIREFNIGSEGLRLGAPLNEFQGVLRGVPNFVGPGAGLMGDPGA